VGGGVQTGSNRHVGHFWPIVPAPGDCQDGEFGGMKIGMGNRSTRRKPVPAPLCPPHLPLDQSWARILAAAVWSQRLTASAMARPICLISDILIFKNTFMELNIFYCLLRKDWLCFIIDGIQIQLKLFSSATGCWHIIRSDGSKITKFSFPAGERFSLIHRGHIQPPTLRVPWAFSGGKAAGMRSWKFTFI
jgi:hypothetical protein